jgi:histidine triad (HIT) family protein
VIPTRHLSDIWGVGAKESHVLADATLRVAAAVAQATNAEGMNILQSNGVAAGQSIFHLHVHIVPRKVGDRMPILWPDDAEWGVEQLDAVADDICSAMGHC